jgi:hypothetical protein
MAALRQTTHKVWQDPRPGNGRNATFGHYPQCARSRRALEHSVYAEMTQRSGVAAKFIVLGGVATIGLSLLARSRRQRRAVI